MTDLPPQGPPQPPEGPEQPPQAPPPPPPGFAAPPGAQQPHQYSGAVPPGGWQQPIPQQAVGGQLAGWGSRVGAYLIDGIIVGVPAFAILLVFGIGFVASDDDASFAALIGGLILTVLVYIVIALLYAPLLMRRGGAQNGQTWGKQLLGIRVVRDNGRPFDFSYAALREVVVKGLALGIAGSIIPLLPYLLDYLWPLWDDENRALHDMVVSTHVVKA